MPNAGTSYVIGNVIEQPAANSNPNMLAYGEEGASNPAQDLYVVNNTFLNDAGSGTFVMVGSGVTAPILLQNNLFAGPGTATNQSNASSKTNYAASAPGFVNRVAYDLHPTANALIIDAGSTPGTSPEGVSLVPVAQYAAVASGVSRPVSGALDIGAYETVSTVTTTPTPTPAPTPAPTPTPTVTWTTCAGENATLLVHRHAPGALPDANGIYVTKSFTGSGQLQQWHLRRSDAGRGQVVQLFQRRRHRDGADLDRLRERKRHLAASRARARCATAPTARTSPSRSPVRPHATTPVFGDPIYGEGQGLQLLQRDPVTNPQLA